jgi:hypothetical protein
MSITVRELLQLPHLRLTLTAGRAASTTRSAGCTARTCPIRGNGSGRPSCC